MNEIIHQSGSEKEVDARLIFEKIQNVGKRISESAKISEELLEEIKKSNENNKGLKGDKKKGTLLTKYDTEKLYDLIKSGGESSLKTFEDIGKILNFNSENIKDFSELLNYQAMLLSISYKNISENSEELEKISLSLFNEKMDSKNNSSHINMILKSQINRLKRDKEIDDEILNFKQEFRKVNSRYRINQMIIIFLVLIIVGILAVS